MPITTTADGVDLFVKDWGKGPAILFLHSASVTHQFWQYQHVHFAEASYRVVAFDRRGHGRSDTPDTGYDADTLADDIAHVIKAGDLRDLTLVGHSMACGEIVRYLARHGSGRVARIILVSGTTPFLSQTPDNPNGLAADMVGAMRDEWRRDFPQWIADNARPFVRPETGQAVLDWAAADMAGIDLNVALTLNRTVVETDFRNDCRAVSVPTLIIHGDKDVSAPIDITAYPTAALIRNSRLVVYEGGPHGLMLTHADRLHTDMRQFMEETATLTMAAE